MCLTPLVLRESCLAQPRVVLLPRCWRSYCSG
ncbi:hypothetical protein Taro_039216 [Colocasia esculenta]|uniref:Uncharacterized protein n=1 Tax=Colocasia esculenta TaxID=4460 RepID=A0A843WQX0_COLES|nr:hypothetical protein [Colocasia esculenta]